MAITFANLVPHINPLLRERKKGTPNAESPTRKNTTLELKSRYFEFVVGCLLSGNKNKNNKIWKATLIIVGSLDRSINWFLGGL